MPCGWPACIWVINLISRIYGTGQRSNAAWCSKFYAKQQWKKAERGGLVKRRVAMWFSRVFLALVCFVVFGVFCLQRSATCYNKLFIAYWGGASYIHTSHYTIRSPRRIPKSISKASFESFKELCPFTLHWLPKSMQHISEAIINVIIGPWSCTETRRKITKMMPRPRNRDYAIKHTDNLRTHPHTHTHTPLAVKLRWPSYIPRFRTPPRTSQTPEPFCGFQPHSMLPFCWLSKTQNEMQSTP